jgi:hypothetical protein
MDTRMHSDWFSGVGELHARVPVSLGAGALLAGDLFAAGAAGCDAGVAGAVGFDCG